MNEEGPLGSKNTMLEFSHKSGGGFPSFILWITFFGALAFVGVVYYMTYGMDSAIAEERQSKATVDAQLSSEKFVEIEQKATDFQEVFSVIQEANSKRVTKKELLDELYLNFTKDVRIRGISLGSDGSVTIDGYTASYRSVADFMLGISMSDRVSGVVLKSAAQNNAEGAPATEAIVFSVSAKLDTAKRAETVEETDLSTDTETENDYYYNSGVDSETGSLEMKVNKFERNNETK